MTAQELDNVRETVEQEGFHYAFIHYSDFDDVKDEQFHRLRLQYLAATSSLSTFLNLPGEMR